jgi:hypothetical protein
MTVDHPAFTRAGDHHKYVYMAEHGVWDFHVAPFCWRIGEPLIARVLPFGIQSNFRVITLASLWLTGIAMYMMVRAFGGGRAVSTFAMLAFFGVGWATKYAVFDFWLPDPAALAIATLAMWSVLTRRDAAFAVLLTLGVMVKESVLFVALLYWTLPPAAGDRLGRLVRGLIAVLPAVIVLMGLRMTIPAMNHDAGYISSLPPRLTEVDENRTSYTYSEQLSRISWQRVRDVSVRFLETAHSYTVGSFGVLVLVLPLFALRRNARLLVRLSPLLILVYFQLLLATDTQRLLVLGLPAVMLMAVSGVDGLARRGISVVAMLPLPLLVIGMNLWKADRMAGPSWMEACLVGGYLVTVWWWGRKNTGVGHGRYESGW